MARDYHAERIKTAKKVHRQYDKPDGGTVSSYGLEKPFNTLIGAMALYADQNKLDPKSRLHLHKLAWFLGMNGETQACEAIMEKAQMPVYINPYAHGMLR